MTEAVAGLVWTVSVDLESEDTFVCATEYDEAQLVIDMSGKFLCIFSQFLFNLVTSCSSQHIVSKLYSGVNNLRVPHF